MECQDQQTRVSVIIPNYNGARYLECCVESLLAQSYGNLEILIVDNASTDGSAELVRRMHPCIRVLPQRSNLGFAAGANAGMRAASGELVAVLNNDTTVSPRWLEACVAAMGRYPEAAFIACRILEFGRRDFIYSAGDCYLGAGIGYRRGQEQRDRQGYRIDCPVFSACGCAALFRRVVLEKTGGYEEEFFAYLEDVDLGLRLQAAGYSGWYIAEAEVYHHGGATSGGEFSGLAVRLRTRNAILLLIKSLPAMVLFKSIPRIALAQIFWLGRVLVRRKLGSYLLGCLGIFPKLPRMISRRAQFRKSARVSDSALWELILQSEHLACRDFRDPASRPNSLFLKWYFSIFQGQYR